jgi:flagellar hook assembly protein FlgD
MEQAGDVKISIYNINGQKMATIFEESVQEGLHNFKFDDLPQSTDPLLHIGYQNLDSGIYVFLMETDNKIKSKKFTIIK